MAVSLVVVVLASAGLERAVRPPATRSPVGGSWEAGATAAADPIGELTEAVAPPAQFRGPALPVEEGTASVPNGTARLWFAHGGWWAVLPHPSTGAHHIWALRGPRGPWADTGVIVDERPFAAVEVAWTGDRLVVASTGSRTYESHGLRLTRFRWGGAPGGWIRDADFPVVLTRTGAPDTHLAVTSGGRIWLARLVGDQVVVASTDAAGQGFDGFAPFAVDAATDAGAMAMVAHGDEVRIVWRSLVEDHLGEAVWDGSDWTGRTVPVHGAMGGGPVHAEVVEGDDGAETLVTFTTSLAERGSNENDPSTAVVAIGPGGTRVAVASVNRDGLRHPQLVVDHTAGRVAVVATGPGPVPVADHVPDAADPPRVVVVKWAEVADLAFGTGSGQVVLSHPVDAVAPPLVPTGPTDAASGVVMAAAVAGASEWTTVQDGTPAAGHRPGGRRSTSMLIEDTFETARVGAPAPVAWRLPDDAGHLASVAAAGEGSGRALEVRTGEDGERVSACRSLPPSDGRQLVVRAVLRATGSGSASARLLTVRGPDGNLLGAWLRTTGEIEWLTPEGRSRTGRFVPVGEELTVVVTVEREAALASVAVVGDAGTEATTGPVRLGSAEAAEAAELDEVCVAPAEGDAAATVRLDELTVEERS